MVRLKTLVRLMRLLRLMRLVLLASSVKSMGWVSFLRLV